MTQIAFLGCCIEIRFREALTAGLSLLCTCTFLIGCGSKEIATSITVSPSLPAGNVPVVVRAARPSVAVNASDPFSVTQGGNTATGGQWVVLGGMANGTIDATGMYRAPAAVPNPATVSVGYILAGATYSTTVSIIHSLPTVSSILPNVIKTLTAVIAISGNGFDTTSFATVNGTPTTTIFMDSEHVSAIITLPQSISASLQIAVVNPDANGSVSNSLTLTASFPTIAAQPAAPVGGTIDLSISGSGFSPGDVVFLNGKALATVVYSSTKIGASGYLPPWSTGNAIEVHQPLSPLTLRRASRHRRRLVPGPI
jgi:hypothetical protein